MKPIDLLLPLALFWACHSGQRIYDGRRAAPAVIAYYHGGAADAHTFRADQLTHIIFSFMHLQGNELAADDAGDSLTVRRLVDLKQQNPALKVLLSLGGWGGCATCSPVFATERGRLEFAASVKRLLLEYHADGIDLDWEYPAIEGYPGHAYDAADRRHFTLLVQALRRELGPACEISFAAGGSNDFFDHSIDWAAVMPLVNRVHVMTYDLVSGFSTRTGHHTPLYSTPEQILSADYAVRYLDSLGVPKSKIVIGAAFYARVWENVPDINRGLYQPGKFKSFVAYRSIDETLRPGNSFTFYRDSTAQAPYAYSAALGQFATFDDRRSVAEKMRYVRRHKLGGLMFWQLGGDRPAGGLLQAIHDARQE